MREVVIEAAGVVLPARLLDTATARIIWQALPLKLTAHIWGGLVRLDTHLEAYRERGARVLARPGQLFFQPEKDDILIPFGPTPLSRKGELRLPTPSNLWAETLVSVDLLEAVPDGAMVIIARS